MTGVQTCALPISVFRPSEFDGSAITARKAVTWQFWGNYEDGELIILKAEVVR